MLINHPPLLQFAKSLEKQNSRKRATHIEVLPGALEEQVLLVVLVFKDALHRRVHQYLYREVQPVTHGSNKTDIAKYGVCERWQQAARIRLP